MIKFEQYMTEAYRICRNWYAPLVFLRRMEDGSSFEIGGHIPLLTNPLDLRLYLENWGKGVLLPDYEVVLLADDRQFDDLARAAKKSQMRLIVDPLVDPSGLPAFLAGTPIQYFDELI